MEHTREMASVEPRLLDTICSAPPQPTDTLGKKVQALDDEMISILDRKDLDDRTKVSLYNEVLQRYNVSDKHVKEPVRVVAVNESMPASYIRQAATLSRRAAAAAITHRTAAGSARRSLSWTLLARRRSRMEHSMLIQPPERRKALASSASWEEF